MKPEGNLIDKSTFAQLAQSISDEFMSGHLGMGLSIIENLLASLENLPHRTFFNEQAELIAADYRRLLRYMKEGTKDPSREVMHTQLIQKAFRLLQDMHRIYDMTTSLNGYTQAAEQYWEKWDRTQLNFLLQENIDNDFAAQDNLFTLLWTAPQLRSIEEQEIKLFLCTTGIHLRCYMLSALTLSLLHYFDAAKLRLLIEYSTSKEEMERVRAVLAICFATQLHAPAIALYPTLRENLILLQPQIADELLKVQHYICLYRETERLQHKLEKEIIPTLIRVSMQRRKLGFDDMDIDLTDEDTNLGINNKTRKMLADGMQQMARLFHEGMDINLHTFTSLKGFSFFRTIGHWLAPFDTARPEVPDVEAIRLLPVCDSDKYSVSMLYQHLSEEQRQGMQQILDNHSELFAQHSQEQNDELQNVLQSLYRLLKRSPWTALFPDVFSEKMMFIDNAIFGKALQASPQFLLSTGQTMLRHEHYEMAERHLNLYAQQMGSDKELLLQLGRCAQEQGKFKRAIDYYQQACMLEENNPKVLYRLQYCYAHLERYTDQLDCLLNLERKKPDDPNILTETGLCLIQLEQWEESSKRFYKLLYNEQRVVPSMRAIAWCALRLHNFEEAQKFYTRILKDEVTSTTWEDFLNAGHTQWLMGNTKTAVELYREYMHRYLTANPKATDALKPFVQDEAILRDGGISQGDLQLMYDILSWQPSAENPPI